MLMPLLKKFHLSRKKLVTANLFIRSISAEEHPIYFFPAIGENNYMHQRKFSLHIQDGN